MRTGCTETNNNVGACTTAFPASASLKIARYREQAGRRARNSCPDTTKARDYAGRATLEQEITVHDADSKRVF